MEIQLYNVFKASGMPDEKARSEAEAFVDDMRKEIKESAAVTAKGETSGVHLAVQKDLNAMEMRLRDHITNGFRWAIGTVLATGGVAIAAIKLIN